MDGVSAVMDMDDGFAAIVRTTVERYGLMRAGETVLVAVSGGPDSTAMLHVLASLRDEWALTLIAGHLNHGFRGAESDGDADYVVDLCRSLSIHCVAVKADVPGVARRRHMSAQEAARDMRHSFLKRTAAECGATCIALGHTRDDRVETILLNLLRGTGPDGFVGFPALDPPRVRPLYDCTRAQVTTYCERQDLHPRQDSSNAKIDYLRNRTRSELLPYLRSYYNEKADDALLRAAELVSADNEALERTATAFLTEESRFAAEDEIVLARERLSALPIALQRRVLRQAIRQVRGHLVGVTYEAIQGVVTALAAGGHYGVTLPMTEYGSTIVVCDTELLAVRLLTPSSSLVPWATTLAVPGLTHLQRVGIWLQVAVCANGSELDSLLNLAHTRDSFAYRNMPSVVFAPDEVALPLMARSWQPGDRIRLRRDGGTKKLQDLFVDRKIPVEQRSQLTVISAGDGKILAVCGVAASGAAMSEAEWRHLHGKGALIALIPCRMAVENYDATERPPS